MLKTVARLRVKGQGRVASGARRVVRCGTLAVCLLLLLACQSFAESTRDTQIKFVNVADSTQGFSDFSQFPAINHQGSVAFVATQNGTEQQVLRWERGGLRTIASTTGTDFAFFTDDVAMNASGTVAFRATLSTGGRAAGIFTSDGLTTRTIVNSTLQGLPGPGIASPSINDAGTVAFQASRNFFRSAVIFTSNDGTLTPVLDTLNSNFGSFGNVAINTAGEIAFAGVLKDRTQGVFLLSSIRSGRSDDPAAGPGRLIDVVDSNTSPDFFQFGDPVINNKGLLADFAGGGKQVEIFSGNGTGIAARTDPASPVFADFEHPSLNSHGAVAFSTFETSGAAGIFVELTGGASPVAVLQSGDFLFGSRVTALTVGRFALNDHFHLAFGYELEDGRSGVAVAALKGEDDDRGAQADDADSK